MSKEFGIDNRIALANFDAGSNGKPNAIRDLTQRFPSMKSLIEQYANAGVDPRSIEVNLMRRQQAVPTFVRNIDPKHLNRPDVAARHVIYTEAPK